MPNIFASLQKNSFNVKGKLYTVKTVIIHCTDGGKIELIGFFSLTSNFKIKTHFIISKNKSHKL